MMNVCEGDSRAEVTSMGVDIKVGQPYSEKEMRVMKLKGSRERPTQWQYSDRKDKYGVT